MSLVLTIFLTPNTAICFTVSNILSSHVQNPLQLLNIFFIKVNYDCKFHQIAKNNVLHSDVEAWAKCVGILLGARGIILMSSMHHAVITMSLFITVQWISLILYVQHAQNTKLHIRERCFLQDSSLFHYYSVEDGTIL